MDYTWIGLMGQGEYTKFCTALSERDASIGYDAALCIQAVEPWVVDAYNSTNGVSTTFNIVGKGDIPSLSHDYGQRIGDELHLSEGLGTTVDKWTAYGTAFSNSRSTLLKVSINVLTLFCSV